MHYLRPLFTIVLVIAAAAGAATPADDRIRFAQIPTWAKISPELAVPDDLRGQIFVRRQDFGIHLDKNGQTAFIASLIRINQPNALQLGNIAFTWNPDAGKPVVHALKVHRDGTVRDVLSSVKFEILRREDQLEAAKLDGLLTATLKVPDLRVGDELEVAYSLPMQDPVFGQSGAGVVFLTESPSPGRYGMHIDWSDRSPPVLRPTADLAPLIERGDTRIDLSVDNPSTMSPPKDAPPRFQWQRIIEFSDFSSWQSISDRLLPLFAKAAMLSANSPVREEAARIKAAHADPAARAAAALRLVQQQVRYVYVGLNGGNFTPAAAEETWQRRYGDCKGKTVLLLALLKELDIPAEPVLVNNSGNDDGLDQRLPNPTVFDHVLVRAEIAGRQMWLDGTLPPVIPPSLDSVVPYRWVLPLRSADTNLEALRWHPANRPDKIMLFELDARAGFTHPAKIRQVAISRGPQAIVEYLNFSTLTDDQLLSEFRKGLEGSEAWTTIDRVTYRYDSKNQAGVTEIAGTGPIDWETYGKGSRSLVLPAGGFSPPARRQRSASQDQQAPYYKLPEYECMVTTVRLPLTTAAKDWSFNSNFDTMMFGQSFRRSFELRDGSIRMIRANRTLQLEVPATLATADNARIAKFDNSKAVIYYDPASYGRTVPKEQVPATYETDWVSEDSACLAPMKKASAS